MAVPLYARDVGEGTPLVLLHAYPLSSAMWLAQREDLAKRFRVITPDLRGFGGSVLGEEEPSIDGMADDVARLLNSKGIDGAVIVGLGLGGYVALALSRRHAERVLGLVLANTKATADPPDQRASRQAVADRIVAEDSVRVLVDELLPRLVGPTTFRQRALVYGRVRGLVQSTPPLSAAWAQRAMANRPDCTDALPSIRVPTLVIVGSEDNLSTEDEARAMVAALPNAELLVLPRCGHLTAVEQPDLFNQAVGEFVSALGRTSEFGSVAAGSVGGYIRVVPPGELDYQGRPKTPSRPIIKAGASQGPAPEGMSDVSGFGSPKNMGPLTAVMRVYLSTDHDHQAVEDALEELLDVYGLEIIRRFPEVHGSWFRQFLTRAKDGAPTVEDSVTKVARGIELQALHRPQAEVDARQADAVAKLMTVLGKEENAAIQIGSILLVKVGNNYVVRTLTQLQLAHLERNPELFQDPALVLHQLQQAVPDGSHPIPRGKGLCPCGSGMRSERCHPDEDSGTASELAN